MAFVLFNLFFFLLKHATHTKESGTLRICFVAPLWYHFSLLMERILKAKFYTVKHCLPAVVSSLLNILVLSFQSMNHIDCILL